jgi:parallel beta-helix repeat protein
MMNEETNGMETTPLNRAGAEESPMNRGIRSLRAFACALWLLQCTGTTLAQFGYEFPIGEAQYQTQSSRDDPLWEDFTNYLTHSTYGSIGRSIGMIVVDGIARDARGQEISLQKVGICTATLIAPNRAITNAHCVRSNDLTITRAFLRMDYHTANSRFTDLTVSTRPVEYDDTLDYAVLEVLDQHNFPTVRWQIGTAQSGESLFIIHHSNGEPKRISRQDCSLVRRSHENQNVGKPPDSSPRKLDPAFDRFHFCDVTRGSSGSLVFADRAGSATIVGLHFAGTVHEPGRPIPEGLRYGLFIDFNAILRKSIVLQPAGIVDERAETPDYRLPDPPGSPIPPRGTVSTAADLIRAAAEGGTIRLAPGVYRIGATLQFHHTVELLGSGRNQTIIVIGGASEGLHFHGTGSVTINGLTIERESGNGSVVQIEGDRIVRISEARVTGGRGGDEFPYGAAVLLRGSVRGQIESSTFDRSTIGLVVMSGPPTLEIARSIIQDNEKHGVWLYGSASVLANNDILRNGWSGVSVAGSGSPIIRGNDIRRNAFPGIAFVGDASGTATGNTIEENQRSGIYVGERAAPTLQNNNIRRNASTGIAFVGDASGTATGNTIEENQRNGIYVGERAAPTLQNNNIRRNAWTGISLDGDAAGTATGNTITGNQRGIYCGDSARAALLRNTIRDNPDYGIGFRTSARCNESGNTMTGNGRGNQVSRW